MEQQNRTWWVPRFALNESVTVEAELKERYCRQFQKAVLSEFDRRMTDLVATISPTTPDEAIGQYAVHLARRVNLLKMRLDGRGLEALRAAPQPPLVVFLPTAIAEAKIPPEDRKRFRPLYHYYLIWRTDAGALTKEMSILQAWLKHIVTVKGRNLQWLAAWIDRQSACPPSHSRVSGVRAPPRRARRQSPPRSRGKGKNYSTRWSRSWPRRTRTPGRLGASRRGWTGGTALPFSVPGMPSGLRSRRGNSDSRGERPGNRSPPGWRPTTDPISRCSDAWHGDGGRGRRR